MTRDVFIVGLGATACGRFPDKSTEMLGSQAAWSAIKEARLSVGQIDAVFFGSVYQPTGTAQRTLKEIGLLGPPVVSVEGACASGTLAFWEAWRSIAYGQFDTCLALGAENLSRRLASGPLPLEDDEIEVRMGLVMPAMYALRARRYMEEYGVTSEQLAQVVVKSRRHATLNPKAQFRKPETVEQILQSPMVSDPLTRSQCCAIGDAGAAAVLCSKGVLKKLSLLHKPVRVLACVAQSGRLLSADSLICDPSDNITRAANKAYEMAGVGPSDIDVAEVHDAFSIAELTACEALGFCEKGDAMRLLEDGRTSIGGDIVVNPGGGLLSRGHPVGATGLLQIAEITSQLRGDAGDRQVSGARLGLVETMGGGQPSLDGTAGVVAVLGR